MRSVWAEYSTFSISDEVGLWYWAEYSTFSISDEVGLGRVLDVLHQR